jgi:hypothetical protein
MIGPLMGSVVAKTIAIGEVSVAKLTDAKFAIPEQHRSGKQQNSPREA